MPAPADNRQLAPGQLADLSRLADGTIDRARASEVRAQVSASPRLTELYERERRAVAAVHEARARGRAPAALRTRIEVQRTLPQSHKRRRVRYQLSLVGALAALVGAVVLVAPSGVPAGPSISRAAALGPRGPEAPAPAPARGEPAGRLDASLQHVYFPDWWARFGWRATGQREDRIDGRLARTIYYASGKTTLSYTIVSAHALRMPPGTAVRVNGTEFRTLAIGGRLVVPWRRAGHTCVLSGPGGAATEMRDLAAWRLPGPDR